MTITGYSVVPGYPRARMSTPEPLGAIERSYEVQLRVQGNDDQDGPERVYAYVVDNVAAIGDSYVFGNDADTQAYLYEVNPSRVPKSDPSAPIWLVDLRWKTFSSDDQKEDKDGEDGEKTDDPTQWLPEVRTTTRKVEEAVTDARYIEGYTATADSLLTDYVGPVVNSTLEEADPPAVRTRSLRVYEITTYSTTFYANGDDAYLDKVNEDEISFTLPDDSLVTLEPRTAYLEDVVWQYVTVNQRQLWRRTVILVVDPREWRKQYLDKGKFARALDGDPDGHGGSISAVDRPAEAPTVRKLVDDDDNPIECKLNGDGQPLQEGDDPVYGTWAVIEETAFAGLALG